MRDPGSASLLESGIRLGLQIAELPWPLAFWRLCFAQLPTPLVLALIPLSPYSAPSPSLVFWLLFLKRE